MSRPRDVQVRARKVKGLKVITQRRRSPAQSELKATELTRAPLDLSRATYLSVPQAVEYLARPSAAAFYMWVGRHQVPKCHLGRTLLFLRRDLDEAVQPKDRQAIRETRRVS